MDGAQARRTCLIAVVLLALVPLGRRWLTLLPLGGETARSLGMALKPSRFALLLLAAADGGRDLKHRPVELYRVDGTAYGTNAGLPADDAATVDCGVAGRGTDGNGGLAGQNCRLPVSDPGRVAGDLYRRTLLCLSAEKSLIRRQ